MYRASAPQEILVLTIELSQIEICDKAASFKSTEVSAELQSNCTVTNCQIIVLCKGTLVAWISYVTSARDLSPAGERSRPSIQLDCSSWTSLTQLCENFLWCTSSIHVADI